MAWDDTDRYYLGKCHCGAKAKECGGRYRPVINKNGIKQVGLWKCSRCGATTTLEDDAKKRCNKPRCTKTGKATWL
jgi:hypothetical protein